MTANHLEHEIATFSRITGAGAAGGACAWCPVSKSAAAFQERVL
jgi:hypothetical protein